MNFYTPTSFDHILNYAFRRSKKTPTHVPMTSIYVFQFKSWLDQFMTVGLQNHSFYRSFKFVTSPAGKSVMFYKPNALSITWLGVNESQIEGTYSNFTVLILRF